MGYLHVGRLAFSYDVENADLTMSRSDGPADAFVSVSLLGLPLASVQELDAEVRAGTRSSQPVDVAEAMAALPITWPAPGTLMVTNGKRSMYGTITVRVLALLPRRTLILIHINRFPVNHSTFLR